MAVATAPIAGGGGVVAAAAAAAAAAEPQHDTFGVKPTTIDDVDLAGEWSADVMRIAKHPDFNVSIVVHTWGDTISGQFKRGQAWDRGGVARICAEVRRYRRGNILDVGANIGTYALPLSACLRDYGAGGGRLIAVEGSPNNSRLVRVAMKHNNLTNVHLYEYAVGSPAEVGAGEIVPVRGNAGMNHLGSSRRKAGSKGRGGGSAGGGGPQALAGGGYFYQEVHITTLDTIAWVEGAPMKHILAMKVDIEGHEASAFEGATEFFRHGPCFIWIEMKYAAASGGLAEQLYNFGYVCFHTCDGDMNAWCTRSDVKDCLANLT